MAELSAQFMKRLTWILDQENVTYDKKVLAELIIRFAPDWRRVINECQRYSLSGTIDTGILSLISNSSVSDLIGYLKAKDFKKMRAWVTNNMDTDTSGIFRSIYDSMTETMQPGSIPRAVLILAEYQYKNAFVADHELNVVACLTELMAEVEWN